MQAANFDQFVERRNREMLDLSKNPVHGREWARAHREESFHK